MLERWNALERVDVALSVGLMVGLIVGVMVGGMVGVMVGSTPSTGFGMGGQRSGTLLGLYISQAPCTRLIGIHTVVTGGNITEYIFGILLHHLHFWLSDSIPAVQAASSSLDLAFHLIRSL